MRSPVELDHPVLELTRLELVRKHLPAALPRFLLFLFARLGRRIGGSRGLGTSWQQQVEQPRVCRQFGLGPHLITPLLTNQLDSQLDQVADHRLNVTTHVTDFGELRSLDLQKRRAGKPGQAPRDLRLAHTGRSDHQDVLRHDLFGHLRRQLLASGAIAQGDGHGTLGPPLTDDEAVQLLHDLARGQIPGVDTRGLDTPRHVEHHAQISSIVSWSLV